MMGMIWESKKEDPDVKRLRFAEILACFLLPAFCLWPASFLGAAEGEVCELEKADIMQEQEEEEPAEDNSAEASEEIWQETTDTEDVSEFRLEWNHNPYFFPEDTVKAVYSYRTGNSAERDDGGQTMRIEMSVCMEKAFYDGILYSLKAESIESGAEEEGLNLGYFYVQREKIYLIRDVDIDLVRTGEELGEAGTVICQPGSEREDFHKNITYGWHEFIRAADGKCAFYSYSDEKPYFYEYFVWQDQKGLTEYRRGYGREEETALLMEGVEQTGFVDEKAFNPYFFPEGVTTVGYDADFDITGVTGEMEVKLSVCEELALENGILYSMKIMNEGDLRFYDSMISEEDKKRMDFGYFYVQPDKIYWIKELKAGTDISERELMEEGRIVCQFEPLEPDTEPDEDWCYGGVGIQGDMCTFGRSQGGEGTFFWEDFVWLKGFGLIEYRSGWGACRDMIYIMMK